MACHNAVTVPGSFDTLAPAFNRENLTYLLFFLASVGVLVLREVTTVVFFVDQGYQ